MRPLEDSNDQSTSQEENVCPFDDIQTDESVIQSETFQVMLRNFSEIYQRQLAVEREEVKRSSENLVNLQKSLEQRDQIIQEYEHRCQESLDEITQCKQTKQELELEHKKLKAKFLEMQKKYVLLETTYDENTMTLRDEINKFKQLQYKANEQLATLKAQNQQSKQEYERNMEALQSTFEAYKRDVVERQAIDAQQRATERREYEQQAAAERLAHEQQIADEQANKVKEFETKINALKDELKAKDDVIIKYQQEKLDLEKAKNAIIEEQAYKMRQVERVFGQPVMSIPPQASNSSNNNRTEVEPLMETSRRTIIHAHATPPTEMIQPSSSVIKRAQNRKSQQNTKARPTTSRKRPHNNANLDSMPVDLESDNESTYSHWRPVIPLPNSDVQSPQRGFIITHRVASSEEDVGDSSQSFELFDKLKRTKD